ncbi:glycosyltransferase family 4 protein [Gordonia prachuapensis]|uniref:glycosyltransferase family 4 protein n=1 Tax=Gordonia prachuapensis TaxID=3115651 RepID=UPI003D66798E
MQFHSHLDTSGHTAGVWSAKRSEPLRVLHITDSSGGVASAIRSYVSATPDFCHRIFHLTRRDSISSSGYAKVDNCEVVEIERKITASTLGVVRQVRLYRPDIVHLHSSRAGFFGRLLVKKQLDLRIVYTPHCYAFERTDLNRFVRTTIMGIEALLSLNTSVVAACSQREADLAQRLARSATRVTTIPNVADWRFFGAQETLVVPAVVCAVGRLTAQKDPAWFMAVAEAVQRLRPSESVKFMWIGGGDKSYEEYLRSRGVEVTGWVDESRVDSLLQGCLAYIHSAAWEGFPVALLNAVACGIPPVVRDVPSFGPYSELCVASADEAARRILALMESPSKRKIQLAAWKNALRENSRSNQETALRALYAGTSP